MIQLTHILSSMNANANATTENTSTPENLLTATTTGINAGTIYPIISLLISNDSQPTPQQSLPTRVGIVNDMLKPLVLGAANQQGSLVPHRLEF